MINRTNATTHSSSDKAAAGVETSAAPMPITLNATNAMRRAMDETQIMVTFCAKNVPLSPVCVGRIDRDRTKYENFINFFLDALFYRG